MGGVGGHRGQGGQHVDPGGVLDRREREVVLQGVGQFDVADRVRRRLDARRHPRVPGRADAGGRPGHRLALARTRRPRRGHRRQVVGEDVVGAAAVRPVHGGDRLVGEGDARVELGDGRVVPLGDRPEEDAGDRRPVQLQAGLHTRQVVGERDPAQRVGHLEDPTVGGRHLGDVRRAHGDVGGAEVDGAALEGRDAGATTDGLVVHGDGRVERRVGVEGLGEHRLDEGRPGAGQLGRTGLQVGGQVRIGGLGRGARRATGRGRGRRGIGAAGGEQQAGRQHAGDDQPPPAPDRGAY